jgi:3-dehydroquinate synthase
MTMSFEVNTRTRRYPVYVGRDILHKTSSYIPKDINRIFVITDNAVSKFHLDPLLLGFENSNIETTTKILHSGENFKTLDTASVLLNFLLENNASRSDTVLALGGGVIGDLAGFVASTAKRGMRLAQLPTTLLAQVDSAIGGKTGVNHTLGKNLIGTFYQPHVVVADVNTLRTLPKADYVDGIAEAVKYAVIMDSQLMDFLLENKNEILRRDSDTLALIVKRCLQLKARVIEADENEESRIRQVLNFGHTVGHAIETCSEHKVSHGHAVSIGMVEEAYLAIRMGLLNHQSLELLISILTMFGLPTEIPSTIDKRELSAAMQQDKKITRGQLVLPVLVELGRTEMRVIDSVYK